VGFRRRGEVEGMAWRRHGSREDGGSRIGSGSSLGEKLALGMMGMGTGSCLAVYSL